MNAHRPEVADVFRAHADQYQEAYGSSAQQRKVLHDLSRCRTRALGAHKKKCDRCGHEEISYNSCRNRHCPKCRATAQAQWLEARDRDLLPVPYFHVVFTLPDALGRIALQNKRRVYGLLFRAVSETLQTIARDPKHLGAQIGFLAVLHTWGQNLHHHPHVHCVIPGGGLCIDGDRWVACRPGFFLPVRVLSRRFRNRFLALLRQEFDQGHLSFHGKLAHLAEGQNFSRLLRALRGREWVVYAKPPFGGPQQVLKYLARYTHRVAISNQRLVALDNGKVTFRWKDYAQGNRQRTMTLDSVEFIRRFLLHTLPKGFQRIRQFGFLANRVRGDKLRRCRKLLGQAENLDTDHCDTASQQDNDTLEETTDEKCPACNIGRMRLVENLLLPIADNPSDSDISAFDTS